MLCRLVPLQLWLTESFFSQYRSSLRNVVYDYYFYTSGKGATL